MKIANVKQGLRVGGLVLATVVAPSALADGAYSWGDSSATNLSMSFPYQSSELVSFSSSTDYDFGPSYHYNDARGPYLVGNPSVSLYAATDSFASGSSTAGEQATSVMSWLLTNNTSYFATAEVTYQVTLATQSWVTNPVTQGAFGLEDLYSWDSMSGNTNLIGSVGSSTLNVSNDYEASTFTGNLFYVLNPYSSATVQIQESSTTYALATPEPTSVAAMSLGIGLLGLRRSRKRR